MPTVKQLREERATNIQKRRDLVEAAEKANRDFSDDEQATEKTLTAKCVELANRIKRQEELEAQEAELEAEVEDFVKEEGERPKNAPKADPDKKPTVRTNDYRLYGRLKNFPQTQQGLQDARRSFMWLGALAHEAPQCIEYCRQNGIEIKNTALTEGSNTGGGYLVIPEFESAIIAVRDQWGTAGQSFENVTMGSNQHNQPKRTGAMTGYWVDEAVAPTESEPTWAQVTLNAKTLAGFGKVSADLEMDAGPNMVDNLAGELGYTFSYSEDLAGWNGDGTSTYGGFTGLITKVNDGTHTTSVVTATGHTTFSALTLTDFETMVGNSPTYVQQHPQASWFMSGPAYWASAARLAYAAGGNMSSQIQGPAALQFLGFPVKLVGVMNATLTSITGQTGAVLFGVPSLSSRMGRRTGVIIQVARELFVATRQIAVYGFERVAFNSHTLDTPTPKVTGCGPVCSLTMG